MSTPTAADESRTKDGEEIHPNAPQHATDTNSAAADDDGPSKERRQSAQNDPAAMSTSSQKAATPLHSPAEHAPAPPIDNDMRPAAGPTGAPVAAAAVVASSGLRTDGGEYPIDMEVLAEVIERRNMDQLAAFYGGVAGFADIVKADPRNGIASSTVGQRQAELGVNELDKKEPVSFLDMLLEAFSDRVIQILCVAAIVSIIFGLTLPDPYTGEVQRSTGWIKGVAILISVGVVTMIGAVQNYNKAKKFEEMEAEQAIKQCSVFRDGQEMTIDSVDLVVGDVLILETGMELTCDGLLIRGEDLRTNESPITGEPDLIDKSLEKDVFLVSGTSVEEGTGTVMIAAVGMNSFRGKLKAALADDGGETPLEEHLTKLGDDIGVIGLIGSVGLMLALSLKEVILITTQDKQATAAAFLGYVIIAITLIAVAIPEGLPLAVTISLAFAMRAMMEENCMVRVLASCETMGAATAICSDKTGTLTTNEMTVVQALIAEEEFVLDGYGVKPRDGGNVTIVNRNSIASSIQVSAEILDTHVVWPLSVNSTARQQTNEEGKEVWVGNKTEAGMLGFIQRLGRTYQTARDEMHTVHDYKQFPFSSAKKRMTTIAKRKEGYVAYIKGASETILSHCDRYVNRKGEEVPLDDAVRAHYDAIIVDMAKQGNRTIGFAYNATSLTEIPENEPEEMLFVFAGVLGIQDPIREEVPDAVFRCGTAHLSVRMVTGDNINTAIAISKKCGIFDETAGHIAMTGPDFREMFRTNKEKLIDLLPNLRVLARSSPNDKYVLVGMLQDEHGEVVGVTGDGTNDAPALKLADVGFAMNSGTDIAKGASAMVLIDDNFATVITAIKWGRSVNDNIKKFIQYQLAINAAGVWLTIIGSLASTTSKEPIAPVQLLWLNLIMDTLAALSLATERPEEASLTRLPVYKQAPLIGNKMRAFIGIHGTYQFTIVMLILFLGHKWFNTTAESELACKEVGGIYEADTKICMQGRTHSTILFNTFIWFQIFNVVNARKIHGELNCFEGMWDRSKIMLSVFAIIITLQVLAVEVGGSALSTTGLGWRDWLICIGFGFSEWPIGFFVRLLPVHDYVPTKEEIIAHNQEEKRKKAEEEEEKAKEEAAANGGAA